MGKNYDQYWPEYLSALEKNQLTRGNQAGTHEGKSQVKILYFMDKLIKFTTEEEDFELPDEIKTVQDLLALLRERGLRWQRAFQDDAVQFTVNKEFAELFTVLEHGDEIAFVPRAK